MVNLKEWKYVGYSRRPEAIRKAEIGLIGREDQGEMRGLGRKHEI